MIPHRKFSAIVGGRQRLLVEPLRFFPAFVRGGQTIIGHPMPGIVEDDFGTAADPGRALATDRRFISTNDDRGHVGRAA